MAGKRQNNQLQLAWFAQSRGEAPMAAGAGTEPVVIRGAGPKARCP
jgi:hypothetical protein